MSGKRGVQVLRCPADRVVLMNRGLLRKIQTRVARAVHEHQRHLTAQGGDVAGHVLTGGELVHAPNRKVYFEDEGLETHRLTKYLWWAFAMLAISAVGLPVYWLREPFRQKGAGFDRGTQYFADRAVKRGEELFQVAPGNPPTPREPHFGCEACHGVEGVGGVAPFTLTDPVDPTALPKPRPL